MSDLRIRDIRDMSQEEQAEKLQELRAELMRVRSTGQPSGGSKNTMEVRQIKKTIARILTVQNEAEKEEEVEG
jgi:large subunit ribosomal protein L29